jgi:hypothetical protein
MRAERLVNVVELDRVLVTAPRLVVLVRTGTAKGVHCRPPLIAYHVEAISAVAQSRRASSPFRQCTGSGCR